MMQIRGLWQTVLQLTKIKNTKITEVICDFRFFY